HCCERNDPLEKGRPRHTYFQSFIFSAGCVFFGAAGTWRKRHHVGTGHRGHTVLSAAHVSFPVSNWTAGAIFLWRNADDYVRRFVDLPVRPDLLSLDRRLFLL